MSESPSRAEGPSVPVIALCEGETEAWLATAPPLERGLATPDFKGRTGQVIIVPGPEGAPARVLLGLGPAPGDPTAFRSLAGRLPAGSTPGIARLGGVFSRRR